MRKAQSFCSFKFRFFIKFKSCNILEVVATEYVEFINAEAHSIRINETELLRTIGKARSIIIIFKTIKCKLEPIR